MRTINLLDLGTWKSVKVLIGICEQSPQVLFGFADVIKRVRIVEAIRKAQTDNQPAFILEDADWDYLVQLIDGPCTQVANREVANIMLAVKEAAHSAAA